MERSIFDFKNLFSIQEEDYSSETYELIYEWADVVTEAFSKSAHAAKLSKAAPRYFYLIKVFAEMAYNYHTVKPGYWTDSDIEDVCCYLIPKKLIAPKIAFKQLPLILKQFFLWGEEIAIFPDTSSWRKTLADIKNDIVDINSDPSSWGWGKSLMMRI